jgi:hypothetical protein
MRCVHCDMSRSGGAAPYCMFGTAPKISQMRHLCVRARASRILYPELLRRLTSFIIECMRARSSGLTLSYLHTPPPRQFDTCHTHQALNSFAIIVFRMRSKSSVDTEAACERASFLSQHAKQPLPYSPLATAACILAQSSGFTAHSVTCGRTMRAHTHTHLRHS